MAAFGAPAEQLRDLACQLSGQRAKNIFGVWPENWRAVSVFCGMGTQWRLATGMQPIWLGLEYSSLDDVESRTALVPGVPEPSRSGLFDQIRSMERCALEVLNKAS